jgi:hypothetical protein
MYWRTGLKVAASTSRDTSFLVQTEGYLVTQRENNGTDRQRGEAQSKTNQEEEGREEPPQKRFLKKGEEEARMALWHLNCCLSLVLMSTSLRLLLGSSKRLPNRRDKLEKSSK